jgi:hypothetical protein
MAGGFSIPFLADVGRFLKGTDSMADALDDVADSLGDLATSSARDAEKAGDKLGDGFKDGARTATQSLDKVDDSLKDTGTEAKSLDSKVSAAFKSIAADAKASGDKVGKSQKEGFKEAESGVKEFGEEANSTAKESAASFDGSAESILGSFQEVAANAFAGFGPAGALAGLAVAAGIGIAVTQMQAGAEAANEMKAASIDLAGQIIDAGGRIEDVDLGGIISAWGRKAIDDNWITPWTNEASTNFQETAKDAKAAGVDVEDAIRGSAGAAEDSQALLAGTADAWQELSKRIQEGTTYTGDGIPVLDASAQAAKDQRDALSDLRGQAEANIKTTGDAVDIAKIETGVTGEGTAAIEAKVKALEDEARAKQDAAGNAMDAVTAEIAYNDSMAQGAKDIATNGKGLDLHTAVGKANQQTLIDMAGASNDLRDAQIAAGDSTADITAKQEEARTKFLEAADAAGMGKTEAEKLATAYGLVPTDVPTYVKAYNIEQTKQELSTLPKEIVIPLRPDYNPTYFQGILAQMSNHEVPVMLRPRVGSAVTP